MVEIIGSGNFGDAVVRMLDNGTIIPVMAILLGCIIAAIAIIAGTVKGAVQTKAREKTRSEIAAYIAEGSMTADEGERLLNAGRKSILENCT